MNKAPKLIKTKIANIVPQDEATALISQAINKGIDVATMEKLIAMRRELRAEKAKEDYDGAMATFQAACPTIERKKQGYNYKYAPLESIVEQVRGLLAENGFSYTFDTQEAENGITVFCKVKHTGGYTETSQALIKKETTTKMNASQQSGAAMTYGKRYAFCNAFGILTGDEDIDGATMDQTTKTEDKQVLGHPGGNATPSQSVVKPPVAEKITLPQQRRIYALLTEKNKTHDDLHRYITQAFAKKSVTELTKDEASRTIKKLESIDISIQEVDITEADYDAIEGQGE
jgi:hypothetical protein